MTVFSTMADHVKAIIASLFGNTIPQLHARRQCSIANTSSQRCPRSPSAPPHLFYPLRPLQRERCASQFAQDFVLVAACEIGVFKGLLRDVTRHLQSRFVEFFEIFRCAELTAEHWGGGGVI
jgi:hypothetical protein